MSEPFDKSCVLVPETPNVTASSWVLTEVATVSLCSPSTCLGPRRRWVSARGSTAPAQIVDARSAELEPSPKLLDLIADFVRRNIAPQGARRRRWQRRMLRKATRRSHVTDGGEWSPRHG